MVLLLCLMFMLTTEEIKGNGVDIVQRMLRNVKLLPQLYVSYLAYYLPISHILINTSRSYRLSNLQAVSPFATIPLLASNHRHCSYHRHHAQLIKRRPSFPDMYHPYPCHCILSFTTHQRPSLSHRPSTRTHHTTRTSISWRHRPRPLRTNRQLRHRNRRIHLPIARRRTRHHLRRTPPREPQALQSMQQPDGRGILLRRSGREHSIRAAGHILQAIDRRAREHGLLV